MKLFDPTTHHAYIICGHGLVHDVENIVRETFDMRDVSHPDFFLREYDTFGINDARDVRMRASSRTFSGSQKVFLLSFKGITREAQNALLKVLEEPTENTTFVCVVPDTSMLLPTLLSRVEVIFAESGESELGESKAFYNLPLKDKLEYVTPFVQEGDRLKARVFLTHLISYIHGLDDIKSHASLLSELQTIQSYALDSSSSLKLLLEHTALVVDIHRLEA